MAAQIISHRLLRSLLHSQVHCGVNFQTAGQDLLAAESPFQIATNLLGEIGGAGNLWFAPWENNQLFAQGLGGSIGRNIALLRHSLQHITLAVLGLLQVTIGRVTARSLGQTGQYGAFGQGQVLNVLGKVVLSRRLNSISPVAEINLIEIEIKNLFLGQMLFHAPSQDRFFEFAGELPFRGQ